MTTHLVKNENARQAGLIKFGHGGGVIEYSHGHLSGAPSDPDIFLRPYHWWADDKEIMRRHWDSFEIPAEGVPVIDIRAAVETDAGYRWVFEGPMVDVRLAPGAIDALPACSQIMLPAVAAYGMAGCLVQTRKAQAARKAGSLDSVSVAEYVDGWRDHGARVGLFTVDFDGNGKITWED